MVSWDGGTALLCTDKGVSGVSALVLGEEEVGGTHWRDWQERKLAKKGNPHKAVKILH